MKDFTVSEISDILGIEIKDLRAQFRKAGWKRVVRLNAAEIVSALPDQEYKPEQAGALCEVSGRTILHYCKQGVLGYQNDSARWLLTQQDIINYLNCERVVGRTGSARTSVADQLRGMAK